jgi:hypothetical protein
MREILLWIRVFFAFIAGSLLGGVVFLFAEMTIRFSLSFWLDDSCQKFESVWSQILLGASLGMVFPLGVWLAGRTVPLQGSKKKKARQCLLVLGGCLLFFLLPEIILKNPFCYIGSVLAGNISSVCMALVVYFTVSHWLLKFDNREAQSCLNDG